MGGVPHHVRDSSTRRTGIGISTSPTICQKFFRQSPEKLLKNFPTTCRKSTEKLPNMVRLEVHSPAPYAPVRHAVCLTFRTDPNGPQCATPYASQPEWAPRTREITQNRPERIRVTQFHSVSLNFTQFHSVAHRHVQGKALTTGNPFRVPRPPSS